MNQQHRDTIGEIMGKKRNVQALEAMKEELLAWYFREILENTQDERAKGMYKGVEVFIQELKLIAHSIQDTKRIKAWQ